MRLHERTRVVDRAGWRLEEIVEQLAVEHELSTVETAVILARVQQRWMTYMLRDERHPGEPGKPADEQ